MAEFDREDFKLIPEFTGNPRDLPRFISLVSDMNDELADDQKPLLFRRLGLKLKDKSYQLYKDNEDQTWDSLKGELAASYLELRDSSILITEMQKISQGKNENVQRYADRMTRKLTEIKRANEVRYDTEAIRNAFNEEHSRIALNTFKDGLKDPLRILVKAARDDSLQAAIATAKEEEGRSGSLSNASNADQKTFDSSRMNSGSSWGNRAGNSNQNSSRRLPSDYPFQPKPEPYREGESRNQNLGPSRDSNRRINFLKMRGFHRKVFRDKRKKVIQKTGTPTGQ